MKNIINFVFIGISVFFIVACTPYNLEPKYTNNDKNIIIDKGLEFKIKHVNYDKTPIDMEEGEFERNSKSLLLSSNVCSKIQYQRLSAGHNSYISGNHEVNLREFANNKNYISCDVVKINNLKFFTCYSKRQKRVKTYNSYSISSSEDNQHGFSRIERMLVSPRCFSHIKEHYIRKANSDKIKIKKYSF